MEKRKLPKELISKQEKQRQETIDKIQSAIWELKSEDAVITVSALVKRTMLSRSTFQKDHVIKILEENHIGNVKKNNRMISNEVDLQKQVISLRKSLAVEQRRLKNLRAEKELLEQNYQFLLGKYHRAIMIAYNNGIYIDLPDIEKEK